MDVVRTPFSYLAERVTVPDQWVRRAALATLVCSVLIIVTGGAVRLTGSGLGCPTWPTCTSTTLAPTSAMGVHGVIEFSNRMLTDVICIVVGLAILASRCAKPWRKEVTRLGWYQFWIIVGDAVVGGITVLTHLNPYVVSCHFLLSMLQILASLAMWQRTREGDGEPVRTVGRPIIHVSRVTVAMTALLIAAGTLVTGSGPHPGDSSDVKRMPFNWDKITQFHADFAMISVGLAVAMIFVLLAVDAPAAPRRLAKEFLVVLLAQGVLGFVQYFTHVPELLVGIHMLGAALCWVAVLRLHLSLRVRPQVGSLDRPADIETLVATA
ncbi:COX15/CtaA family protein [Streptacidiphilus melanogenes]|uniref:COX15/CtaA family protein n=1 Tax=Streptacidiphilus melanogenes TaxID=411235 RepID=UPI0005A70965|nr:COX15/CtaA family protein [Streptacidiphilus melanogenes]